MDDTQDKVTIVIEDAPRLWLDRFSQNFTRDAAGKYRVATARSRIAQVARELHAAGTVNVRRYQPMPAGK